MSDFAARRTTMVDTQIRPSDVTKFPIIDAMLTIRREAFVPPQKTGAAYIDDIIDLGEGRFVLDPRTFARMLDGLDIQPEDVVLDLGCGLGYSSAILGHLAESVIAIEQSDDMVADAEQALTDEGVMNVAVLAAPIAEGSAKHGPYDVIVLQGAVQHVPDALTDQLVDGGRIAAIWDQAGQGQIKIGYKLDGAITWRFVANAGAPVLPGLQKHNAFAL
ncbi:MAG: protein-L-isoaspartate O-methyltransferase [Pseudomonadota bacterium]